MEQNSYSQQKANGAILGSIVIIIIIVVGGYFLIKTKVREIKEQERLAEELNRNAANSLSSSDDVNAIEIDLNKNSNIDSIDTN